MTEEEKIKRARDIICHDCRWNRCDNNACPTLRETVKAIELGLAEGRKESCEVCEKEGIKEYQKLFDKQKEIIEELKKENEQLKQQIEKMKCCSNCKWFGDCSNYAVQNGYTFSTCSKCNNWELAK